LKAGAEEIDMNMRRGLEAICGIVAGGLGLVTLVYVLFFLPAYTGSGSTCDSAGHCVDSQLPNKTIAEQQGVASLLPIIVVGVLLFVAIIAGALWDGLRDELPAKALAIMASILAATGARGQRSGMA
jgi:hypothetical protein